MALKQQIENRLNGAKNDSDDEEEEIYYPYGEYADVMTYQSILHLEKKLENCQKKIVSRYIYVICDEAHFFTSDAMFNPHTHKILSVIIRLFQDAVRVYMSATPYECLQYLFKYGEGSILFYHFKRSYSYLDVKTYSSFSELYEEIIESVNKRKEKWLIFIDDKEKCIGEKRQLEKFAENMKSPLVVEKDTKKDDKDKKSKKKIEKVYAVDADSKKNSSFQEIIDKEKLNGDTYVLISTSVLDNGVNLEDIKNIVVSDMSKTKCLQMAGRARVKGSNDRKTLYIKRFSVNEAKQRKNDLMEQQDAYHSYEMACDGWGQLKDCYDAYLFLEKYYNGSEKDWEDAKHWFGIHYQKGIRFYLNEIAQSLMEKAIPQYQSILAEMLDEELKEKEYQEQGKIYHTGQKYLEHQLSWFGKKYCEDDDITFADKEKAKKAFIDFLESYAESGEHIEDRGKESPFRKKFTELSNGAFGYWDQNKDRCYDIVVMNKRLKKEKINYKIVSHSKYWVVARCNWEMEDSE